MPGHQRHAGLNARQDAFVRTYVKNGGNGSKTARDVGYSAAGGADRTHAARLLANGNVQAAIEKETVKFIKAADLTPQDIVDGLLAEAGLNGKKPKDSHSGSRVRSLELLGKTFALFADRQVIDENEIIDGRELVLRLSHETPAAAIGMAIDLCLLDLQMADALQPATPKLAVRMRKLIAEAAREPDAKLLDVMFKQGD